MAGIADALQAAGATVVGTSRDREVAAELAAVNLSMNEVCKMTIFMTNLEDYGTGNEVYGEYFETLPARSTVKVAELLMGARVEIEAIAVRRSRL
jgi:2-iminobutanoate/2-iminopropanoate deaminase